MICRKCFKEIPDESVFCMYCATKQQAERTKKRPNGSGTIRKIGKKYELCVTVYDPKRRSLTRRFDKKSDAISAAPALRQELIGLAGKTRESATVGSLYEIWLNASAPKLSPSKQLAYKIAWNRIKAYEHTRIDALDLGDLQYMIKGLNYYPARDIKYLLSHIYKRACAQQDVTTNLAQYIELPTLEESEAVPFSADEVRKMWTAWDNGDEFVDYLLLMIYTGMMPGELMQCRASMIDLDKQQIVGAGLKTKERKKKPILIPAILLPLVIKMLEKHPDSLVKVRTDLWYEQYHDCTKRLGIRDLPPYSCRHTTASMLAINENIAPALITKAMRQTRPITTERYKHAESEQILTALNQLK